MSRKVDFRVAPGGIEELAARGLKLADPATGLPIPEHVPSSDEPAVLFGDRAGRPAQVPGTRGGYTCARCGAEVQLAPSGQGLAARGTAVQCIDCFPFFMGGQA